MHSRQISFEIIAFQGLLCIPPMLPFFQFHTSHFGPFRCCDGRWRVVKIGLWSNEKESSGVQSQWWWMPLWKMVTSGEEKPPKAGSLRVASSASLRKPL